MKVVILAGGFGTRISEESHLKPKPMIEIGGQPILWHIMKYYSYFGHNDFIICAGYQQHIIKEYFADYYIHRSDVTFDFTDCGRMIVHNNVSEPWKVTIIDTGLNTMTGGRIKRIKPYLEDSAFMLTYGDGVSNVDIAGLVDYHKEHKRKVTITAVQPGGRFGVLDVNNEDGVNSFQEKTKEDGGWVNAGFMVVEPEFIDYIADDATILEREPLERAAKEGNVKAFKHTGFWQCMDTLREKNLLDSMWESGQAPWKVW